MTFKVDLHTDILVWLTCGSEGMPGLMVSFSTSADEGNEFEDFFSADLKEVFDKDFDDGELDEQWEPNDGSKWLTLADQLEALAEHIRQRAGPKT